MLPASRCAILNAALAGSFFCSAIFVRRFVDRHCRAHLGASRATHGYKSFLGDPFALRPPDPAHLLRANNSSHGREGDSIAGSRRNVRLCGNAAGSRRSAGRPSASASALPRLGEAHAAASRRPARSAKRRKNRRFQVARRCSSRPFTTRFEVLRRRAFKAAGKIFRFAVSTLSPP